MRSLTVGRLMRSAILVLLSLFSLPSHPAQAQLFGQPDPNRATTSRAARENAIQLIPFEKLTPDGRARATWILSHTSVFRRMPIRLIQCDAELYLFMVRHPDVVVNIWEVMGISHITMRQVAADKYQVNDDIGTVGGLEVLYRSDDTHVFYADGTYKGSLFNQEIRGRGLLILKTGYVREPDGRTYITSRLDAFMNIEPGTVEFLTKTFQPAVGRVADGNFTQTASFIACLQKTVEVNNRGVQRLAGKLTKIAPEVRQQFAELSDRVAERSARTPGSQVPLPERVLPRPVPTETPRSPNGRPKSNRPRQPTWSKPSEGLREIKFTGTVPFGRKGTAANLLCLDGWGRIIQRGDSWPESTDDSQTANGSSAHAGPQRLLLAQG